MSKIKLFIGASIDGYIARPDGDLDWLDNIDNPNNLDHGYQEFLSGIDTTIMGSKTYQKIISFGIDFPYKGLKNYVLTRNKELELLSPDTFLQHDLDSDFIAKIKEEAQKDIWIVGGGEIITEFLNRGLIDEMILSIAPVILGDGIPLFAHNPKETNWQLVNTKYFDTGIVSLTYLRK